METIERAKEAALARQLMAGDAGAFDRFVDYFRPRLFHYSWLMCGQREDAEEVAQETLLKVFESADQLREPDKIKSWVFRIAKNVCLMKRRKSLFAPVCEISLDEHGQADGRPWEVADRSALPEGRALQSQMKVLLEKAIRALPESYRSIILLRDVEELSTQETAQILEVSEDVVKTRLHRARLAIRRLLERELHGERGGDNQHAIELRSP